MLRYAFVPVGLLAATLAFATAAQSSDTCQRYTGGKCKPGQKTPKGISSDAVTHQEARPPARGNHKGRDAYTPAQREKFMEQARQICRKKFGAPSRVYTIDYKKNLIWCEPPSY